MGREGRLYGCPVELALDLLGGKWKTVIVARLKERPLRYGELRRSIPALSDKVLTQRLRELADDGFVIAPSGEGDQAYRLSARGRTLVPLLQSLFDWGLASAPDEGVRFR